MEELWMRVGITFELTHEEVEQILGDGDPVKLNIIVAKAIDGNRFRLEGETYVPESEIENFNRRYGTSYEPCECETVFP